MSASSRTGVKVYGCNHIAIEVEDIDQAVAFYKDVFNLEQLDEGEGDAFFKLGEHQFLAIFEVEKTQPANMRHFGIRGGSSLARGCARPGRDAVSYRHCLGRFAVAPW